MNQSLTLTDVLAGRNTMFRSLSLALTGTLFIALMARVAIPLPFSPIPFTGQTFAVLLVGALLGKRLGALTVAMYVAEGAAGLPVFAMGAGPAYLLGPTGGYLLGCIAAAWVTGALAERGWDRKCITAVPAMAAGNAVIYVFGLAWLSRFVDSAHLATVGLYPFMITDLLKVVLAATLLPAGWSLIQRFSSFSGR
jgi:biotin transport system substrate-specific component